MEMKVNKGREARGRPGDGCPWEEEEIWEDPGKIHRSVGVQCSGVLEEKEMREGGQGWRDESEDK